jgi:hypothetical protein
MTERPLSFDRVIRKVEVLGAVLVGVGLGLSALCRIAVEVRSEWQTDDDVPSAEREPQAQSPKGRAKAHPK